MVVLCVRSVRLHLACSHAIAPLHRLYPKPHIWYYQWTSSFTYSEVTKPQPPFLPISLRQLFQIAEWWKAQTVQACLTTFPFPKINALSVQFSTFIVSKLKILPITKDIKIRVWQLEELLSITCNSLNCWMVKWLSLSPMFTNRNMFLKILLKLERIFQFPSTDFVFSAERAVNTLNLQ